MTTLAGIRARLAALPDVVASESWGEEAFFVNPGGRLPHGSYFATIKQHDGPNDAASRLGDGRWRLNLGIGKPAFEARFGPVPARPGKGGTVAGAWDFAAEDTLTPHPVYGWMGWVAVVCPRPGTLEQLWPLAETAHARAARSAAAKLRKLPESGAAG